MSVEQPPSVRLVENLSEQADAGDRVSAGMAGFIAGFSAAYRVSKPCNCGWCRLKRWWRS